MFGLDSGVWHEYPKKQKTCFHPANHCWLGTQVSMFFLMGFKVSGWFTYWNCLAADRLFSSHEIRDPPSAVDRAFRPEAASPAVALRIAMRSMPGMYPLGWKVASLCQTFLWHAGSVCFFNIVIYYLLEEVSRPCSNSKDGFAGHCSPRRNWRIVVYFLTWHLRNPIPFWYYDFAFHCWTSPMMTIVTRNTLQKRFVGVYCILIPVFVSLTLTSYIYIHIYIYT